jgi:hypothetical protein
LPDVAIKESNFRIELELLDLTLAASRGWFPVFFFKEKLAK